MAFNSYHFLAFFPLVFTLYYLLPQARRWLLLLAASLYFYGVSSARYLLLLLATIAVSFFIGLRIEDSQNAVEKKRYMTLGMVILFGNLFVFKYFNFFNNSLSSLFHELGLPYGLGSLSLALPIGISFYTFQKASYLVDIYRGKGKAERGLGIFTLYATFFPQLVAGPIERGPHLLPQFHQEHHFDYDRVSSGLRLMAWGFFKKTVVADRAAPFVNQVYNAPTSYDGPSLILATLLFTFQVYCDFSAYSDIAIGCARTLGFDLMTNFRQPYYATSISDFWKRWHISLSTWLTDYVYTPLSKAKWLKLKWYPKLLLCLILTFLVSGLWHGANWTFVFWGALHGSYLVLSVLLQKTRARAVKLTGLERVPLLLTAINMGFTFFLVVISYIFFRANTLTDAFYILSEGLQALPGFLGNVARLKVSALSEFYGEQRLEFALVCAGIFVVMLYDLVKLNDVQRIKELWQTAWIRRSFDVVLATGILLFGAFYGSTQSFIYFEF
jgi:alginate O-acetyltransferase complex protein AlgI